MSDVQGGSQEPPLHKSTVYRGPQTPALQFYVPLPVFLLEACVLVAGVAFLGWYTLALLPLHVIPMEKTSKDPFWVRDLWADISERLMAGNKGQYGKNVVTYSPEPPHIKR